MATGDRVVPDEEAIRRLVALGMESGSSAPEWASASGINNALACNRKAPASGMPGLRVSAANIPQEALGTDRDSPSHGGRATVVPSRLTIG